MRPAFRRLCAAAVFSAAAFVLSLRVPNGVETSVLALAGGESQFGASASPLAEIAAASSRRAHVIFEGDDADALARRADSVAAEFGAQTNSVAATISFLAAHRRGLLSPETRNALLAGRADAVAAASLARLFGPMPPAVSPKLDPFQLVGDFALSLQTSLAPGWSFHGGHPTRTVDGRRQILLPLDLSRVPPDRIRAFLSRAEATTDPQSQLTVESIAESQTKLVDDGKAESQCADDSKAESQRVAVWCAGAPFHSALTAERSKREINLLSSVSLALVALFGWLLLRSFRFVPVLAATLLFAFTLAAAALYAAFPRPHIFTFVFGTSLIGLAVDYVYHTLAAGVRAVRRPLALALATSVASFAPLLFAPVDTLRQMSLFTIVGLVAAWLFVQLFSSNSHPKHTLFPNQNLSLPFSTSLSSAASAKEDTRLISKRLIPIALLILLLSSVGLVRVRLSSNPAAFYSPSPYLAVGERKLLDANPSGANGRFVFVRGENLQDALKREESAGLRGVSAIVPSLKRQRENAALIAKLHAAEATNYAAQTGLKLAAPGGEFIDAERIADPRLAQIVAAARVPHGLVAPCPDGFVSRDPKVVVVEPRRELAAAFSRFTSATLKLLAASAVALALLLVVLFRRRALRVAAPVAAAIAATAGTLGWFGVPITFFTLLCFFALVGLGLDYSIFRFFDSSIAFANCQNESIDCGDGDSPKSKNRKIEKSKTSSRAVFYSFLTSLAGLGMLAFTDFAVTRQMGITFALGLTFSWLFAAAFASHDPRTTIHESRATNREPRTTNHEPRAWHDQPEQSAGPLRIRALWLVYRLLGKDVAKAICVAVVACAYPFARSARAALADFYSALGIRASHWRLYRHLLSFAWGLVDKTDACSLKKNLPKMNVVDDDGWRSLQRLLATGRGAFIVTTHLGTAEVLPALSSTNREPRITSPSPFVHAFQQISHNSDFMREFMRHFDFSRLALNAVESIGVETAVAMQEAISRGELVMMAGDRTSAGSRATLRRAFLGRECAWPKGTFVFAKLLDAPIFFVSCVRVGWNEYAVRFAEFKGDARRPSSILAAYADFLETETRAHPGEWFHFHDFFAAANQ